MAKVKAGKAVTWVTQKAVELLGPLGYSTELLVEKWMRDAKINDIYEGTGQINTLIVAREILGYTRQRAEVGIELTTETQRTAFLPRRFHHEYCKDTKSLLEFPSCLRAFVVSFFDRLRYRHTTRLSSGSRCLRFSSAG